MLERNERFALNAMFCTKSVSIQSHIDRSRCSYQQRHDNTAADSDSIQIVRTRLVSILL